ncbi:MAG: alpha/beta hydrolase, partial [Bacteroidota bacterium]
FSISLFGQDLEGKWNGKTYINEHTVDFTFTISKDNKTCFVEIPVNKVKDLPASNISVDQEEGIVIEFARIKGSFVGKYDEDKDLLIGKWKQGSLDLDLSLQNLEGKNAKAYRPQTPEAPFNYISEEVSFKNVIEEDVTLAGTLTYPEETSNLPAIVFISGSGPQDRNSTLFDHKPFWVMADYFTRRGYATLRYDDRGIGKSTGTFATATTYDFAEDAKAALNYLTSRTDIINPRRIVVIGHSEGGMVAQILGAEREDVAIVVSLAGPGLPLKESSILQNYVMGKAMGLSEEKLERNKKFNGKVYDLAGSDLQGNDFQNKMRSICMNFYDEMDEEEKKAYGNNFNRFFFATNMGVNSPWYRAFIAYDPADYLRKIKVPFLALNGTKDLQVTLENLDAIEIALEEGECKDYLIKEFENLNHLFQTADTGLVDEYQQINETINIKVLEEIYKFTRKRLKFR